MSIYLHQEYTDMFVNDSVVNQTENKKVNEVSSMVQFINENSM